MERDRRIPAFKEDSLRPIFISYGSALVTCFIGYWSGGTFFPPLFLCFGFVLVLRGHCPNWFFRHFEEQIVAMIPYRREHSIKVWFWALMISLLLATAFSWTQQLLLPAKPDISHTILNGVQKIFDQSNMRSTNGDTKLEVTAEPKTAISDIRPNQLNTRTSVRRSPEELSDREIILEAKKIADKMSEWLTAYYREMEEAQTVMAIESSKFPDPHTVEQNQALMNKGQRLRNMVMDKYLYGFEGKFKADANALRVDILRRLPVAESVSESTLLGAYIFLKEITQISGGMIQSGSDELRRLANKLETMKKR